VKHANVLTTVGIEFVDESSCWRTKPKDFQRFSLSTQQLRKTMTFLVQPPAHSVDAYNPLFIYTLADPISSELRILEDLQDWGWEISVHSHDDVIYLDAVRAIEKAIKTRRRRTQMIYGDMVGDSPRLTLEEMWHREATKKSGKGRYEIKEEEVDDTGSIMSRMTQQRLWVRWADEGALDAKNPDVSRSLI
jgi:hypothetical protein